MKRALFATVAALALAGAAFVTPADARGGRSGGHSSGHSSGSFSHSSGSFGRSAGVRTGGNFSSFNRSGSSRMAGNHFPGRGVRHGHFRHGRFIAFGPGYASYGYADGCVVPQRVLTDYGWRLVYVNVCTDDYTY
jgi:hypothetical protein